MKSKEEESVMRTFIGQTRDLSECSKCTSLLLDPVEAKCGHYFCRGCITELLRNSTGEQTHLCGVCQTIVCKNDLKELNPKMSKITSSLQHFLQDFCREGEWKIDTFLSSSANGQQNSRSLPLNSEGKEKTVVSRTTAADIEEGSGSVIICSSSSSGLAHQSTLEPEHKVHQWLMTNPNVDPLAVTSEEDGETPSIKSSKTLSKAHSLESKSTSKLVFTPVDISSSTGKESSYDIVSAPSPPPSREIPAQQVKRGRGGRGRGRGRTRKNALPISSGEPPAKKRGRSAGNTPETKPTTSTTPKGQPDSSPELDNTTLSKAPSTATTSTPLTRSSKPPIDIHSRIERSKVSRNETSNHVGEGERNISICIENSCVLPTHEAVEKSSDTSARLVDVCEPYLNCVSDVRSITPRPFEPVLADRSNIHVLPPAPASAPSPQLDKPVSVPSTAYHLTPVSRPRVRNSLGSAIHDLQTSEREFRRHSISDELRSGTGRRNVTFFHKGRIVPGKPISSFKRNQIVFTRLGKLGPYLDRPSACHPVSVQPPVHAQKCFEDKETQTFPPSPVSFSLVSTQTEPVEASVISNKESHTLHTEMKNQAPILPDKAPSIDSVLKSLDAQLRDEDILEGEPDEYSEDLFMSAEPFKRARVLSSSDSDDDKMETKRKKPCPPAKSVDKDGPISSLSHFAEGATTANVPQRLSPQQVDTDLASKTVVMESDPDEDDILVATPPHPPAPKPVPCQKKVLTCSGLPRPLVKMVEDWARRVGAEVSLTYTSAVTHIIVQVDEENCAQRTLKFLYGVASGKWIVGIDWIHQCIREARLIDEEPFEALDMDGEDGPRRARQISQRSKLFEAFEFCCQEPFTDVSVEQLNELLMLCGAATANSPTELTKNRRHSMIIVQTDDDISPAVQRKAASWFERLQVLSVSREWVLDCLASYQLLSVRSQLIGKHSESMLRMMGFDSHLLA